MISAFKAKKALTRPKRRGRFPVSKGRVVAQSRCSTCGMVHELVLRGRRPLPAPTRGALACLRETVRKLAASPRWPKAAREVPVPPELRATAPPELAELDEAVRCVPFPTLVPKVDPVAWVREGCPGEEFVLAAMAASVARGGETAEALSRYEAAIAPLIKRAAGLFPVDEIPKQGPVTFRVQLF